MIIDIPDNWLPTSENINALPKPLFDYIHGIEMLCNLSGTIAENTLLSDQEKAKIKVAEKWIKDILFPDANKPYTRVTPTKEVKK